MKRVNTLINDDSMNGKTKNENRKIYHKPFTHEESKKFINASFKFGIDEEE